MVYAMGIEPSNPTPFCGLFSTRFTVFLIGARFEAAFMSMIPIPLDYITILRATCDLPMIFPHDDLDCLI
jgi:hypothetical protein